MAESNEDGLRLVCCTYMCEIIAIWSASGLSKKSPLLYSLSDSTLVTTFFIFFVTNRSNLLSKLGKPLWSTKFCVDECTFVSTLHNVNFTH